MKKMEKGLSFLIVTISLMVMLSVVPAGAAPVLDAGWDSDVIVAASTDSLGSPYIFTLTGPASFSITDAFIVGDQYSVYDFGSLILTTSLLPTRTPFAVPSGDGIADAAWSSGLYQTGQILLSAASYSLTVQGDGVGGLPAGFYTRLDSVPEPSTLLFLGSGLAALGFWRMRKGKV